VHQTKNSLQDGDIIPPENDDGARRRVPIALHPSFPAHIHDAFALAIQSAREDRDARIARLCPCCVCSPCGCDAEE